MYVFFGFVLFVCLFVLCLLVFQKRGGVISYMYVIAIHVSEKMGTGGDFKFSVLFFCFFFICFVLFRFVYFFYFLVLNQSQWKRGGGRRGFSILFIQN